MNNIFFKRCAGENSFEIANSQSLVGCLWYKILQMNKENISIKDRKVFQWQLNNRYINSFNVMIF